MLFAKPFALDVELGRYDGHAPQRASSLPVVDGCTGQLWTDDVSSITLSATSSRGTRQRTAVSPHLTPTVAQYPRNRLSTALDSIRASKGLSRCPISVVPSVHHQQSRLTP